MPGTAKARRSVSSSAAGRLSQRQILPYRTARGRAALPAPPTAAWRAREQLRLFGWQARSVISRWIPLGRDAGGLMSRARERWCRQNESHRPRN